MAIPPCRIRSTTPFYEGESAPSPLLSGHHANIARWRRERSLALTAARRPELIESARAEGGLSKADERYLAELAGTYDPATDAPKRRRKPSATPAQPPKTPDAS
ncbi:hypothetical protein G6F40_015619 [Rhizopus arrhizus]|nr:hypothetical protein G6F40_015619 [Rhizopus arrhizus]